MIKFLNILRLFFLCFALFYLAIFLWLASIQDTQQNMLYGVWGACFGLLMERLLNYYANRRKHKPTA